ncbi:MAG: DUF6132 family protein [Ignavibacteriaceae bacterium]|nr:DUF6132 family protein [Ignavibacteriaceae bacterium]
MDFKRFINIKTIASVAAGALLGFGYYYFVGCRTGTCPISGNPYISTLYGAMAGLIMVFPSKKKREKADESNNQEG